jgi:hypothetical protein
MGMTDILETRVGLTEQMAKMTALTRMVVVVVSLLVREELQTHAGEHSAVMVHPVAPRIVSTCYCQISRLSVYHC